MTLSGLLTGVSPLDPGLGSLRYINLALTASSDFIVVASFGRSAICLNEDSIALTLQSCLGGEATNFRVKHLLG
jgi:hypothetical protein